MTAVHGSPAPTSPAAAQRRLPTPRRPGAVADGAPASGDALALWTRVEQARLVLADLRCRKPNTVQHAQSRVECLDALQEYADCLVAQRRPVPYALRDELRLMRLTCGSDPTR